MKPRISVRVTVYRDRPGYSIAGKDHLGRAVRIFTESLADAEHIRDRIKAGDPHPTNHRLFAGKGD